MNPNMAPIEIRGQVEQFGRILDPVKAHALSQAVRLVRRGDLSMADVPFVTNAALAVAKEFEGYLAGDEEGTADE
jgi:hypothetical protein